MRTSGFTVKLITFITLFVSTIHLPCYPQSVPLANAFAHNDYWHKRPLFDALQNGYTHIEADIFNINNELIVAHLFPFFKKDRTLDKLYLQPLYNRVKQHGQVFPGYSATLTLMIDIKTGAEDTYKALKPLLTKYRSILSSYENGKVHYRQVTIVLSGNKPYDMVKGEKFRYVFIDEDLRDVGKDSCASDVYPMASCKYSSLIDWNGKGTMPAEQKKRLCSYVTIAHRMGKKVRLWASPENRRVWTELLNCGVDLINTDELVKLKNYLTANLASNSEEGLTRTK